MTRFDHVVIGARDLESGLAWARGRLGVVVPPGGKHERFGTHNRVLRLGDEAYLEILAIDPAAAAPSRARWFGLDDANISAALQAGPRLLTWVARSDKLASDVAASTLDLGAIETVRRDQFAWKMTLRADGSLALDGMMPALIAWEGEHHPAITMPDLGFALVSLEIRHPDAIALEHALTSIDLDRNAISIARADTASLRARIRKRDGAIVSI